MWLNISLILAPLVHFRYLWFFLFQTKQSFMWLNASIAGDDDTGTHGKDQQGDRADNEEECSVGTDVGEAEDDDDDRLTVSSNTIMSPYNY